MKVNRLNFLVGAVFAALIAQGETIDADILVVGGNEAACAAAVQASREGVGRVVLVNDINRFGGQFSNEGVGPVDERVLLAGDNVEFPRSGMALEVINAIRDYNMRTYHRKRPGNCWSAVETIEPGPAAEIFEALLFPELQAGRLTVRRNFEPVKVLRSGNAIQGVEFSSVTADTNMVVRARLVIDASDFGDILRLGDVDRFCGVDPRSRFGEVNAPEGVGEVERQEMNPITWTITLREQDAECPIDKPNGYLSGNYTPEEKPWSDCGILYEAYQKGVRNSPYSQRRLVDGRHFGINGGLDVIQLNATVQDYPLCQLPPSVCAALEKVSPGASKKNICEMTTAERRVVFNDAKRRALGYLYYLQNEERFTRDFMRRFRLSDEFGTDDKLPPKPYIREGMRLDAMCVVCEQDVRDFNDEGGWSSHWHDDTAFSFQFHIDFHPTRREYVDPSNPDVWQAVHVPPREWSGRTLRAFFPFRALVPRRIDGLLGAGKNVGVSSIVQAAFRLHGQMLLCGQAAGALAAKAVRDGREPREIMGDPSAVQKLRHDFILGVGGHPGVASIAWQDLRPDDPDFLSANIGPFRPRPGGFFYRNGFCHREEGRKIRCR